MGRYCPAIWCKKRLKMPNFKEKIYEVEIIHDVKYGTGGINHTTVPKSRALCMDVYLPRSVPTKSVMAPQSGRPALIMAFGGAFHRGSKEADEFDIEGHRNTPVSEYCHEFAKRGYVTFSIDYRLVQEDPDPGSNNIILDKNTISRSRMDHVRNILGLEPATSYMLWAGVEAAVDDMHKAFEYVYDHASEYGIDVTRIAVGGFSAGARMAASAAYGKKVPAAAIVALSGMIGTIDGKRLIRSDDKNPPIMMVMGEIDLDHIKTLCQESHAYLSELGVINQLWRAPGATHFYPSTSSIHRIENPNIVNSLEPAMSDFLYRSMRLDELNRQ